jgi:hypothetical protein
MTRLAMTLLCWLPALAVSAKADLLAVHPGQWKIASSIVMNGASVPSQMQMKQRCLTPEQAGDVAKTFGPVSSTRPASPRNPKPREET